MHERRAVAGDRWSVRPRPPDTVELAEAARRLHTTQAGIFTLAETRKLVLVCRGGGELRVPVSELDEFARDEPVEPE
jgi:hypothetical protein